MKNLDKPSSDNASTSTLEPFFSVVIATYNRAVLLKRALESLIGQTETDWEAIIIDDGSTDSTYQEIKPYLETFPQIKYIKKKHSGEANSKNAGVLKSRGNYITFLDSDDEYDPSHLASRKRILIQNPEVKFLYGGVHIIGSQFVPDRFDLTKTIDLRDCAIGGSFFIDKDTLLNLDGFRDISLGTDSCLFDRAKEIGVKMMETSKQTYIYHHETQDSVTNRMQLD